MITTNFPAGTVTKPGDRSRRYGYRVKIDDPNPDTRVEYILDAVGMTPAYMDFEGGSFNYGSWENVWFIRDNYPVMLKSDGTEDYRLNPNDYSKKAMDNSTASDVANTEYEGNAMSAIPLVWVKRYQEDGYQYVIFCEEQYDAGYKAYAHTRADGTIAPYVYHAIYEGNIGEDNKLRSISGLYPSNKKDVNAEVTAAKANGDGWNVTTWALWSLLGDLLTLISKSKNSQEKFGTGVTSGGADKPETNNGFAQCGALNDKGQFYGTNSDTTHPVKVFHIENPWGSRWTRIAGLIYKQGIFFTKMTQETGGYNPTGEGYTPAADLQGVTASGNGFMVGTKQTEFGLFPTAPISGGSDSTYETDNFWWNNTDIRVPLGGGSCYYGSHCGARCLACSDAASLVAWSVGASLSYI